jgi:hypothetical protein
VSGVERTGFYTPKLPVLIKLLEIFSWFFNNLNINYFTLDIDSSVITRYGEQESAKKGYNPKKKGRNSHHPIIDFVNDAKLVANFWLRSGDTFCGILSGNTRQF